MAADAIPTTDAGRKGLAAIAAQPRRAVVALDFDGTLAPIVADPADARAHPGAVPVLSRLAPLLCSVAIVTGRPAEAAVRQGGLAGAEGLERLTVLGAYGAERWDAASGEVTAAPPPPGVDAVRRELPSLLDRLSAPEGTSVEDKGRALAVHTRRTDDPHTALESLSAPLHALAERHGLVVEPGRMVLELRPPGVDKGAALTAYLREVDAGAVLYGGDDLGDLAAYAAVERLRGTDGAGGTGPAGGPGHPDGADGAGGAGGTPGSGEAGMPGVLVCCGGGATGESVPEVADRADLVVDGPEGLVRFLDGLADRLA